MAYYCSKCGREIFMREKSCPYCHTQLSNVSGFAVWYDRIWYYLCLLLLAVGCVVVVIAGLNWILSGDAFATLPFLRVTSFLFIPLVLFAILTCVAEHYYKIPEKSNFLQISFITIPILLSIIHYYAVVKLLLTETFIGGFGSFLFYCGLPFWVYLFAYGFTLFYTDKLIDHFGLFKSKRKKGCSPR